MGKLSNKLQFVEFAGSQQTEVCWTLNAQFLSKNGINSNLQGKGITKYLPIQFSN